MNKEIKEALAQPEQPHDLHNRLADLHLFEEIAEHYAKCAISPEALRDWVAERVNAQPEERNFCPRCGKRTADLTAIHTCTPPLPVQPEPVGEGFFMPDGEFSGSASKRIGRLRPAPEDAAAGCTIRLLYITPQQRQWVGLTDDDYKGMSVGDQVVAMWAERTLKDKNT